MQTETKDLIIQDGYVNTDKIQEIKDLLEWAKYGIAVINKAQEIIHFCVYPLPPKKKERDSLISELRFELEFGIMGLEYGKDYVLRNATKSEMKSFRQNLKMILDGYNEPSWYAAQDMK
jgi:hypothetical protein